LRGPHGVRGRAGTTALESSCLGIAHVHHMIRAIEVHAIPTLDTS
jgi:hypothetical protein